MSSHVETSPGKQAVWSVMADILRKEGGLTGRIPHRLRIFQERKEKIPLEIKDVKKSVSNHSPEDL